MKFIGPIFVNEEGEICIKTQITPQNPQLYEIPLIELLEDEELFGEKVRIEIIKFKEELDLE